MFWQKTIKKLRAANKEAAAYIERAVKAKSDALNELDMALESITGYEGRVAAYAEDFARESKINQVLAEQNRDLVRQLELYKAVLSQLQIPIKLPGKKQ